MKLGWIKKPQSLNIQTGSIRLTTAANLLDLQNIQGAHYTAIHSERAGAARAANNVDSAN